MMRLKLLVGILVFLIVMNLAAISTLLYVHFTRPRPTKGWRDRPGVEWLRRPPLGDLSREERRKLFDTLRAFRVETLDLNERTRALEDELFVLMNQSPVPRTQIDSLLQEIADVRLEIAKRATDRLIEARESLTPEQREHLYKAILGLRPRGRASDAPRGQRGSGRRRKP